MTLPALVTFFVVAGLIPWDDIFDIAWGMSATIFRTVLEHPCLRSVLFFAAGFMAEYWFWPQK